MGIETFTRGVFVLSAALLVEKFWQTCVLTSNLPRLLDRHILTLAVRRDQAIHATVKLGVCKAMLCKERRVVGVFPV